MQHASMLFVGYLGGTVVLQDAEAVPRQRTAQRMQSKPSKPSDPFVTCHVLNTADLLQDQVRQQAASELADHKKAVGLRVFFSAGQLACLC